jgi:predicted phosphodiesterase
MLITLGDIHGNFNYVKWYIKAHKIKDCTIYQVGDFGIGFTNEFNDMNTLGDLNKFLNEYNIQMYAIRGNHDNPKYFDGHLRNYFTNLHLLPDYTVINVDGVNILGVGGAVSVDRRPRMREQLEYARSGVERELYWYDEVFVLDEEKLKGFTGIDIVVTHTAPEFCKPDNTHGFGYLVDQFAMDDEKLKDDLLEERKLVTKMWEILKENNKPFMYFYGHFHNVWLEDIDGCEFRLLGINEFYDPKIDYMNYLNKKYGD